VERSGNKTVVFCSQPTYKFSMCSDLLRLRSRWWGYVEGQHPPVTSVSPGVRNQRLWSRSLGDARLDLSPDSVSMRNDSALVYPPRRKVMIFLTTFQLDRCSYEPEQGLLNDDVAAVPYESDQLRGDPLLEDIFTRGIARPGAILLQNPYDQNSYEDIAEAAASFALKKHMLFSYFCSLLGARKVTVERMLIKSADGSRDVAIDASQIVLGISTVIRSTEFDRITSELTFVDTFSGGDADIPAAEARLGKTGLQGDPAMTSLLEMRNYKANPVLRRELSLNLSSETRRSLSLLTNVWLPNFVEVGIDLRSFCITQVEHILKMSVIFGSVATEIRHLKTLPHR
jgi:hypothetical protein